MKKVPVAPAILIASIAAICMEPGVYPVSGRRQDDLERFRAEQEKIHQEGRRWGRK